MKDSRLRRMTEPSDLEELLEILSQKSALFEVHIKNLERRIKALEIRTTNAESECKIWKKAP